MQRLAFVIFSSLSVLLYSCLDTEGVAVLYDTYIDVWVRDEQGNNLLDSRVDGHFDGDDIKLFYVRGVDTTEVFNPRQDVPRNCSVLKNDSNGEFFLRLVPDEGRFDNEQTITLIEWKPGVTDNLKCLVGRNEQAVFIKKIWYNGELRFDIDTSPAVIWGENLVSRFIQVQLGD